MRVSKQMAKPHRHRRGGRKEFAGSYLSEQDKLTLAFARPIGDGQTGHGDAMATDGDLGCPTQDVELKTCLGYRAVYGASG